jgi:hypothetical protein
MGARWTTARRSLLPRTPIPHGSATSRCCSRAGYPVAVARDRAAAGRALLAAHPECDVIVADDGLQHYRLHRDVEIAVVDAARPRQRLAASGRAAAGAVLAAGRGRCGGRAGDARCAGAAARAECLDHDARR